MSIDSILEDVPDSKCSDELTQVAAEYGLVCFKIELANECEVKISDKLIEIKFDLENKLKKLLYA